jgi:hypothetical protein
MFGNNEMETGLQNTTQDTSAKSQGKAMTFSDREKLGFFTWSIDHEYVQDYAGPDNRLSEDEVMLFFDILFEEFDRQGIVWEALEILEERTGRKYLPSRS